MERKGLGRGLSALLADVAEVEDQPQGDEASDTAGPAGVFPIEFIRPNPDQPRKDFDDGELQDLAASIREKGVIQPLILRPDRRSPDRYEIVAGERRWRAAQIANLHELPALVRDLTDTEVLELAIIENIQRADLNAVEEALGYRQLMDRFGHTQERLSEALGKSRSHIANLLRLLNLPESVLQYLRSGKLSAGHARALVTAQNPDQLAEQVIKRGLSVRDTERLVRATQTKPNALHEKSTGKDADTRSLEEDLSASLGMRVSIDHKAGSPRGEVRIKYGSLEELDNLCQKISS